MSTPIMEFNIFIDDTQASHMECPNGQVAFIPFTGRVESDLFTGEILPGGCDVQVENPAGVRHMCARYMFRGHDSAGNACHLFVDNNGWFNQANRKDPFISACPRFLTDSPVLGEYLTQARFRSEVHPGEGGVTIKIFDVLKED